MGYNLILMTQPLKNSAGGGGKGAAGGGGKGGGKRALITGITGQGGSYLAEFLVGKGYEVHGLIRWKATGPENENLAAAIAAVGRDRIKLHLGDLATAGTLINAIQESQPREIYNLGGLGYVGASHRLPEYAGDINGLGCLRILDALKTLRMEKTRLLQASTAEMFGAPSGKSSIRQNESNALDPENPYALGKVFAYFSARYYRRAFGMHACNGIFFNHESPRRGKDFVTRKISMAVANIALGKQQKLFLGNLSARRDWGHARDFVRGMWMILQHPTPDDYVLATGKTYSVREFVEAAFAAVDIRIEWRGSGLAEKGVCAQSGKVYVAVDKAFFRPLDKEATCGDTAKIRKTLGWKPEITFKAMVAEMVQSDLARAQQGR